MQGNGQIRNSQGIVSAKRTWGQAANWCDYAGQISGVNVGVAILASPQNKRTTWWHNRNYGVFVANQRTRFHGRSCV